MQSAELSDYVSARSKEQMIGIAENYSGVELVLEPFESNSFDGALSSDGHEHRRLDDRTPGLEDPGACFSVGRGYLPVNRLHFRFPMSAQIVDAPSAVSLITFPDSSSITADGVPYIPIFSAVL